MSVGLTRFVSDAGGAGDRNHGLQAALNRLGNPTARDWNADSSTWSLNIDRNLSPVQLGVGEEHDLGGGYTVLHREDGALVLQKDGEDVRVLVDTQTATAPTMPALNATPQTSSAQPPSEPTQSVPTTTVAPPASSTAPSTTAPVDAQSEFLATAPTMPGY